MRVFKQILVIICLFGGFVSFGQNNAYFKNTLVVKLKPQTVSLKTSQSGQTNPFNTLGVTSFQPMFGHSNPSSRFRVNHTVDLSLIYQLVYSEDVSIEVAIDMLMATGKYEYVEPRYCDVLFYQPNDPLSDSTASPSGGIARQNQLASHKLYDAWDISKGDSSIKIGILDTGIRFDHEDLGNIAYNHNDSINGTDDDGDMALDSLLLDNFRGWDVSDWDNDPSYSYDGHGVEVAGCASGTCDNGVGVCGTGFHCQHLPIKISHDTTNSTITEGYTGVVYAAEQGCQIINLSWGSAGPAQHMQWQQDVINYAVIDYDALVLGAAGNTGGDVTFYPASYDHVLSVATTRYNLKIAGTTSYNYQVDVNALGVNVNTTLPASATSYGPVTGSSYATPIVAGIAGLVRSHRPGLNALQVAEVIRVTGDQNDNIVGNEAAVEKIGKHVNALRALTDVTSPSVRAIAWEFEDADTVKFLGGDTLDLVIDFQNYLADVTNLSAAMEVIYGDVSMITDSLVIGSLNTLDTFTTDVQPFVMAIHPGHTAMDTILVRIALYGDNYTDYQYVYMNLDMSIQDTSEHHTSLISTQLTTCNATLTFAGDTALMSTELSTISSLTGFINGSITSLTPGVDIITNTASYGPSADMDTVDNENDPYKIYIQSGFNDGDTLRFNLDINAGWYTEDYVIEYIIDISDMDTLGYKFSNPLNTFQTNNGALTFNGDTVKVISEVENELCDADVEIKLISLSPECTVLDSIWNETGFPKSFVLANASNPYSIFIPDSLSAGDSVYLQLEYYVGGELISSDSILFILADSNIIAGIDDIESNKLINSILPNPFSDRIEISLNQLSNNNSTYILYDEQLRVMTSGEISNTSGSKFIISTNKLSNGFYLLKVTQGDITEQVKLVKVE